MELTAGDIMVKDFATIHPDAPVSDAVRLILRWKVRETGYKPFGIMVVDVVGRLVGMVSMFDILYHLRPPFMNYELQSFSPWKGELDPYLERFKDLKVQQVMSSPVMTVHPGDHVMIVIDHMIKGKFRRLPVVQGEKILGMVYLSDVFLSLCGKWLGADEKK